MLLVFDSFAQNLRQEAIYFHNNNVKLSGNLFLPATVEKVPAVVILHGSGPDEGIEYKVYAEEFGKAGIATLVFDKRGSGNSEGDWRKRTFELMAGDATSAVEFLRSRPEISENHVGLWAISQGGWTAAYTAARSEEIAFVISVAGNAISPARQEIWHKDKMYEALGYSENARDTARKFWQMIFDWLVLVDEGKFPVPTGVLESELSGVSIGMNYDSLSDWQRIKQPVLLIHGEEDKLSPANETISRISRSLTEEGNVNVTFKVFPQSSHTITTNKTGLEFDWDRFFAPGYFRFTTDWILANTNKKAAAPYGDSTKLEPSQDFDDTGKFGGPALYGKAYPQLALMLFFTATFLFGTVYWGIVSLKRRSLLPVLLGTIYLLNIFLIVGFYIFLASSIFPQGMGVMEHYAIPVWQKALPLVGLASVVTTVGSLISAVLKWNAVGRAEIAFAAPVFLALPWLWYWNLIGFGF